MAQISGSGQSAPVPRVINISGVFQPVDGQPLQPMETVTLAIYADATGGAPLWQETQNVVIDAKGRYAVLLGAASANGIPATVLAAGPQWLGTTFNRQGEVEGPRVQLTSMPYALRAADADSLGGRPASAYLLATATATGQSGTTTAGNGSGSTATGAAQMNASADVVLAGTPNMVAKYVNSADVGNSAIFELGGFVGINTTTPSDALHVRFTNTGGSMTGLALQNLGNTANSYSGTLFYDQNGQLGQFQGFNNVTHEYRINNVALNGASQLNGSINFMIGGSSRFFASNTGVGIGTTAPSPTANLEVSNAVSGSGTTNVNVTTYSPNPFGPNIVGKKARGTQGTPTAVQNNDALLSLVANGYGTTGFASADSALISMRATEDWTDTAQGSAINFSTTANGTTGSGLRMTIGPTGNVGIGTSAAQGALELFRTGDTNLFVTSVQPQGAPQVATRVAHGTPAAPTAVQLGDFLGIFGTGGHDGTNYTDFKAGFAAIAAENWTGTAQGATLVFAATPTGSSNPLGFMSILPSGLVGIGTPTDVNGLPTATDKLQVFGDVRVGTTGTNGCVKNFAGTGLIGTCSSDRRLKRDITPFGSVLKQLTALQPVHFYWRAAEFPDRHFGDAQTYGLIAQDVEQVFPELVVTGEDGFKAIDYSKLPLLTIQAVKELKAENDDLKAQNDALKERVTEVERLLKEVLATKPAAVRSAKP